MVQILRILGVLQSGFEDVLSCDFPRSSPLNAFRIEHKVDKSASK